MADSRGPSSLPYIPGPGAGAGPGGPGPYLPFLRPAKEDPAAKHAQHSVEELLAIVGDRQGLWHEYAPHLTTLQQRGMTPGDIAEATGMQGGEQSMTIVAAQVYASLKDLGCTDVGYFDVGGAEVLYELRILAVSQRKEAAEYVARQGLDAKGAREVARAIKEHERRRREKGRDAFSSTPADCMAYALFRQSNEARGLNEKNSLLTKALQYASTSAAVEVVEGELRRLAAPQGRAAAAAGRTLLLPSVRLRQNETFPKPVPVLGDLKELSASALRAAPPTADHLSGAFPIFTPSSGSTWVAVPTWPALAVAQAPVAVVVWSTDGVPVLAGRGIAAPLLLVLETRGQDAPDPSSFFLVETRDSRGLVELVEGDEAVGRSIVAKLLVVLLPPKGGGNSDDDIELED